jgi:hypothetical protein
MNARQSRSVGESVAEYRIHGDNIVECHRTLVLMCAALRIPVPPEMLPHGSPLAPRFRLEAPAEGITLEVVLIPGYGRWSPDIIEIIRESGGCLREAADAIVSRVADGREEILLAIEFCGALPAGNQAWQRNGRAFSFARAGIPFLYVAELSGFELGADRQPKAARLPNPAVPFSYLLMSKTTSTPALPVFVRSPGASPEAVAAHGPFYGEKDLVDVMRHTIMGSSAEPAFKSLEDKVLGLVSFLASTRRKADTLRPEAWGKAVAAVNSGVTLVEYLVDDAPMKWAKTAYIEGLTRSASRLMECVSSLAIGLTSSSLPLCVIPAKARKAFAKIIRDLYPGASREFLAWCAQEQNLAVVWVMGFKPRGDDARPDRGLPPLCKMLVGDSTDVLTVVYGPAPNATWPLLCEAPAELMKRNGLWEAVLTCSEAVLVDSSTLPSSDPITLLRQEYFAVRETSERREFLVNPAPDRVGENDVDTVLHLLISSLGGADVFEGLCNPPGGDWSGISLLTEDQATEVRWLTLPRVTAAGAKRPDHVFQLFGRFKPSYVLAVESKETPRAVERGIGPMLRKYTEELIRTPPSVERRVGGEWQEYRSRTVVPKPTFVTAAACVTADPEAVKDVAAKAEVDLVFGVKVPNGNASCEVLVHSCSAVGRQVASFVSGLPVPSLAISVRTL